MEVPSAHAMGCRWSWRHFRCVAPLPPPTSTLKTITATLESLTAAGNRPTLITAIAILLHALVIGILLSFALRQHCQRTRPGLARTIYRLIVCRGRRLPGAHVECRLSNGEWRMWSENALDRVISPFSTTLRRPAR